jgi:hypothetical protein
MYNYNDQLKGYEAGRACSTHEGEEECVYEFGGKVRGKEITRRT